MEITAALRNALGPDATLITDPTILPSYSRDQSQIAKNGTPIAVLLAKNESEISAAVKFAYEHNIPVVARGAGSGLSGGANAIDGSLIISLEKMNQIISIDSANLIADVEPGVINLDLDKEVSKFGLAYLPDPASREWSTIGGNVATNAGGMCCVKYGVTSHHVRAVRMVTSDGSVVTLGTALKKSVTNLDLLHLIIGSEGTLGIVTQVTVGLVVRPKPATTLIATFSSIDSAMKAIPELVALGPSMLEVVDSTTLRAVEEWKPLGFENVGTVLLFQSDDSPEVCAKAVTIAERHGAIDATYSDDPRDSADLIQVRKLAYPALERKGAALLDDVCVPISQISNLVTEVEKIAAESGLLIGIFGHAGDGNMHPTIVYEHGDVAAEQRAVQAFNSIIKVAQKLGGTASGEHGIGSIKVDSAKRETSDRVTELQRSIKKVFDPKGILNPGKKIP
ncbi:MAG: FAD-binding protein [Candidatus Nanopelagicaceae bacterium]|nr:FAD-binding protein [Candidatus Nanopelagicaceae bacterium]